MTQSDFSMYTHSRSLSDLRLTARFLPFTEEASLLLASSVPPSFAFAALRGGFSSLSLGALFGRRVYDSHTRSKPPACFFSAAFVRFRRPPWRLFFAIAQRSLRETSLRLASPAAALPKYSRSPATLRFWRLVSEKNHQKSPRSLKVRQTPRSLSDLRLTARFLPFSEEASLLLASSVPPSFAFGALRGDFSSLSLGALYGMRVHGLAPLQKQASCLLLPSRLRSLSPPSMAAFLRYCSALSSGAESTTRTPEASLLLASSVPPSFVFAAIRGGFSSLSLGALYGMRVHRLAPLQKQASCLLLSGRLRSLSPPSMAAFPRYRSALSSGGESTTRLPTALPKCSRSPAMLKFLPPCIGKKSSKIASKP